MLTKCWYPLKICVRYSTQTSGLLDTNISGMRAMCIKTFLNIQSYAVINMKWKRKQYRNNFKITPCCILNSNSHLCFLFHEEKLYGIQRRPLFMCTLLKRVKHNLWVPVGNTRVCWYILLGTIHLTLVPFYYFRTLNGSS